MFKILKNFEHGMLWVLEPDTVDSLGNRGGKPFEQKKSPDPRPDFLPKIGSGKLQPDDKQ